ncbi:MAG: diaminopimelate epimerase [Proteobacteria bacterium]|nr:diaminopimelate epimerase [Pseudomonadota bacterium]
MKHLEFTKMQGAGNDFVVIDATRSPFMLDREARRRLADRRLGVGCDQLMVVEAPNGDEDFSYRIYNADGGEVEQCGNGVRCVARFIHDRGLSDKRKLRLGSLGGVLETERLALDTVRVNMGEPVFEPARIPFDAERESLTYPLALEGEMVDVGVVSMGNPHAVLQVNDTRTTPVADLGEMLESHPRFPKRVNVGFMQKLDARHIRLRVFERGVGETLACGTGACAAVAWGNIAGILDHDVDVQLPGGTLVVSWQGRGTPVFLTGPATSVFEGSINP